jgi:DNA-binding transcriptional regulator YiaG
MHNGGMRNHTDIIRDADEALFAKTAGVSIHTVRSWAQRKNIPSGYWAALIAAKLASADELISAAAKAA